MTPMPDYAHARARAGFGWSVAATQGALRELSQTPIRDFNLEPNACIEAYRKGRPLVREMFGEDVGLPGLATPAVSYGHVNALGCELLFPEAGEVAHTHAYGSLEEGLAALRQPVDYARVGWAPFFLDFQARLRAAFPGETVRLAFGAEGPITTAYELRGEGFFTDIFDNPAGVKAFLRALTASVLDYHDSFLCEVHGSPKGPSPTSAGLCDDLSSFIPAYLWRELVLPAWDQYFTGLTTGTRSAHVEDLRAEQLPCLEEAKLSYFDPSISPKLHPRIVAASCRVPFLWRLGSFHYWEMSCQEVEDFVYLAAADGASSVVSYVAEGMCNPQTVAKVCAFIRAGKEAKSLIAAGCSREEVGQRASAAGCEKLWEGWCGFLGPKSSRGGARTGPAG